MWGGGGLINHRPPAGAAPWSLISQQVYYSTLLTQWGMARLYLPLLPLGQHLHSKAWPEWIIYYTITKVLLHRSLNKSLALHPTCLNKSSFASKMFEQKSCFAPKMFEQKSSFASNIFEQKSCFEPKMLNKSLALHQNVHEQLFPNIPRLYCMTYSTYTWIWEPFCWACPGNNKLCIASMILLWTQWDLESVNLVFDRWKFC